MRVVQQGVRGGGRMLTSPRQVLRELPVGFDPRQDAGVPVADQAVGTIAVRARAFQLSELKVDGVGGHSPQHLAAPGVQCAPQRRVPAPAWAPDHDGHLPGRPSAWGDVGRPVTRARPASEKRQVVLDHRTADGGQVERGEPGAAGAAPAAAGPVVAVVGAHGADAVAQQRRVRLGWGSALEAGAECRRNPGQVPDHSGYIDFVLLMGVVRISDH